jgi:hypothetical protein
MCVRMLLRVQALVRWRMCLVSVRMLIYVIVYMTNTLLAMGCLREIAYIESKLQQKQSLTCSNMALLQKSISILRILFRVATP